MEPLVLLGCESGVGRKPEIGSKPALKRPNWHSTAGLGVQCLEEC